MIIKSTKHIYDRMKTQLLKKEDAAYTVEAALVMAVTLFLIASLLSASFEVHGEVVSNMVMQCALEKTGYLEEGQTMEDVEKEANQDLRTYFRCSDRAFRLQQQNRRIEAESSGGLKSRISVKWFEPERFLRLLRAGGI